MTRDITGVLSKITSYMKDFNISIENILQMPDSDMKNKPIPIIISTHLINKGKLMKAVDKIENQDFVLEKVVIIPIDK